MKNVFISAILMFLLTSCASTTKFPVSSVTPAAIITADVKKNKSNNFTIAVNAQNLASAERLTPPKKTYVVWIETKDKGLVNIGQLNGKNGKSSSLETLSSFEPMGIVITAEDEGSVSYPLGIEITRSSVRK